MEIAIVLLAAVVLFVLVGTAVSLYRDGYHRVPTQPFGATDRDVWR
jgi:hypothetical protein